MPRLSFHSLAVSTLCGVALLALSALSALSARAGDPDPNAALGAASPKECLTATLTALKSKDAAALGKLMVSHSSAGSATAAAYDDALLAALTVTEFEVGEIKISEADNGGHAYAAYTWSAKLDIAALVAGMVKIDVDQAKAAGKALSDADQAKLKEQYTKSMPTYQQALERKAQSATLERHDGRWFVLALVE